MSSVLKSWKQLSRSAAGRWLFTRVVCRRAPYFSTIRPRMEVLEPGRAVLSIPDRRAMHNHIGTVHAIALCNAAEMSAGLACEVSVPADMRWIPRGMSVRYLKPARGRLRATASLPTVDGGEARDVKVFVDVVDAEGTRVFDAEISMYISPRKRGE